jgi:hypothetical protein
MPGENFIKNLDERIKKLNEVQFFYLGPKSEINDINNAYKWLKAQNIIVTRPKNLVEE